MSEKIDVCPQCKSAEAGWPTCVWCGASTKLANPHDPPVQTVEQLRHSIITRTDIGKRAAQEADLDAFASAARAEGRAEKEQEIDKLKAKLAYTTSAREMLLEQGNTRLEAARDAYIRRWQDESQAHDRYASLHAAAEAEVTRFKELINDDGSLTTLEEHIDILSDAMHHLNIASKVAEQMDALQREVTRLSSLLAQREQAQGWSKTMGECYIRHCRPCGCAITYYERGTDQLTCAEHHTPPAPQEPTQ